MTKKLKVRYVSAFRGLMFRRRPKVPVVFKVPHGLGCVHTWFVFYPIDIALIRRDFCVVQKMTIKPFSMGRVHNFIKYIVEAPAGKLNLGVGDVVELEEVKA